MSDDPEQDHFCDGLVEDIITTLSKLAGLRIVARNSSFVYKGRSIDVREAARQLSVRYVLEGSVRKSGNRVRVTAQLIDGARDEHIWAESYDRDLKDVLALQDELAEAITREVRGALSRLEPEPLPAGVVPGGG
jgi:adenylate cyclase